MGNAPNDVDVPFLARFGLFLARFCLSAWIGAATLFVIVGVTEVTRGNFNSTTKDILVAVRFPAFYVCGVTLVSLGFYGTWFAGNSALFPRNRRISTFVLLVIVLSLMAARRRLDCRELGQWWRKGNRVNCHILFREVV